MERIFLRKTIVAFMVSLSLFFSREYITDHDKHFIRERKMNFVDHIKFIFWNKGRNNNIEAAEYFKLFKNRIFETISQQAIGRQRKYIKPELFIRIYKAFIDKIYNDHKQIGKFKGYTVCAGDSSIIDLPNITLTREDFNIEPDTEFKKHRVRARVSGLLDVNSKLMLTVKIVERTVKETTLAMEHLRDLKNRFDITKFISIFDRGYDSIELMTYFESMDSKFLIRLRKNDFGDQRRKIKGNDKIISINLKNSIIKEFDNENLKEYARELGRLKIRIVEITLGNGTKEILATNLSMDEFSYEEMEELYSLRWEIETGFKKLKSQIQIESFSGYDRNIIEQDFYANIFIYNLATAIQWDGQNQLCIKKRNPSQLYIYKSCFSTIVGIMYVYMEYLLSAEYESISRCIDFLITQASKLYYQKNVITLLVEYCLKILEDLYLQSKYGEKWEDHKPKRGSKDPLNRHPGNPKRTH